MLDGTLWCVLMVPLLIVARPAADSTCWLLLGIGLGAVYVGDWLLRFGRRPG